MKCGRELFDAFIRHEVDAGADGIADWWEISRGSFSSGVATLTQMESVTGIQSHDPTMLDDSLSCLERSFVLIALQHLLVGNRVVCFDLEHGNLRRGFGKFKWALDLLAGGFANRALRDVHAIADAATPAVAPAAPKQAKVARLG